MLCRIATVAVRATVLLTIFLSLGRASRVDVQVQYSAVRRRWFELRTTAARVDGFNALE
jgi:hypothetical protein